jgi:hypothetical protein
MQPRAYREGKVVADLKESVFKAYIVQIRRLRGNLELLLLQSTIKEQCVNHFLTPLTTVVYSAKKRFTPSPGRGDAD